MLRAALAATHSRYRAPVFHGDGEVLGKLGGEEHLGLLLGVRLVARRDLRLDEVKLALALGVADRKHKDVGRRGIALHLELGKRACVALDGLADALVDREQLHAAYDAVAARALRRRDPDQTVPLGRRVRLVVDDLRPAQVLVPLKDLARLRVSCIALQRATQCIRHIALARALPLSRLSCALLAYHPCPNGTRPCPSRARPS
jgi:hypothetical protein